MIWTIGYSARACFSARISIVLTLMLVFLSASITWAENVPLEHGIIQSTVPVRMIYGVDDFDSDGDFDFLTSVGLYGGGERPVLAVNRSPESWVAIPFTFGADSMDLWETQVLDINGDGNLDVQAGAYWYRNSGGASPEFTPERIIPNSDLPDEIGNIPTQFFADVDQDGDNDCIFLFNDHIGGGDWLQSLYWLSNNGETTPYWKSRLIYQTTRSVTLMWARSPAIADFDGDGDNDIACIDRDEVMVYENVDGDSLVWARRAIGTIKYDNQASLQAVDFNEDSLPDIVINNTWGLNLFASPGALDIPWVEAPLPSIMGSSPPVIHDFDQDGDLDVVTWDYVHEDDSFRIHYHERIGDSETEFIHHQIYESSNLVTNPFVMDWDGDGDPDILFGETDLHILRNMGSSIFINNALVFQDMTGDGNQYPGEPGRLSLEIVSRSASPEDLVLLSLNSGDPTLVFDTPLIDLGTMAPGQRILIDLPYTVSDEAVCGSTLTASVEITWENGAVTYAVSPEVVGRLAPQTQTTTEISGLAIPDNDPPGITSSLTFSPVANPPLEFNVLLDITHPVRRDLLVTLLTPSSSEITVYEGTLDNDGVDLITSVPIIDQLGSVEAGDYTLTVVDRTQEDTGTLNEWSLELIYESYDCTMDSANGIVLNILGVVPETPGMHHNADAVVDAADLVMAIEEEE